MITYNLNHPSITTMHLSIKLVKQNVYYFLVTINQQCTRTVINKICRSTVSKLACLNCNALTIRNVPSEVCERDLEVVVV